MADFTMTEEQYQRLMDGVTAARMEVAEVKGAVAAFTQSLSKEQLAREELARKVEIHDVILRGDGLKQSGLADQIGDLRDRSDRNATGISALRKTLWTVGAAVATPVTVDLILRLIQMAYKTGTP